MMIRLPKKDAIIVNGVAVKDIIKWFSDSVVIKYVPIKLKKINEIVKTDNFLSVLMLYLNSSRYFNFTISLQKMLFSKHTIYNFKYINNKIIEL